MPSSAGSATPQLEKAAARQYSGVPFKFLSKPLRDERFPDPCNMGVNAEAFLYDAAMPAEAKVLMMFYKRLREIDVPEMMAGILTETEVSLASRNELASTFQDFDWADEVLHARFGRDWYVSDMPSPKEAISFGDRCWSNVLVNWEGYRASGLTEHRNWWTQLYAEYCRIHAKTPDSAAAAFNLSYQHIRADLKEISASG